MTAPYLGDYAEDATLHFKWGSNDADGASITRSGNGVISVYKADGTTQVTAGITDTEDFDSLTGVHHCKIDLSAATFYAIAGDYQVVLSAATINTQGVNAPIAHFSIENRFAEVDMTKVGGSTTPATNLALMFDGTGYTDPTAPSSRQQVDNIGAASGGALSFAASSDNTSGAIDPGSTTKVWATVSGTFANTENDAGSSHDFTDTTDVIDHVYGFSIGGGRQAVNCVFKVNVDGNNDEMLLKAWDFVGAGWETIAVLGGTGGTATISGAPALFAKHTGTGSELGNVYLRMDTDSTTPSDLAVHLLNVEAVNIGQTSGYLGQVWIDTVNGVTGTEPHVNGVSENYAKTLAEAKTIGTAVGISDFHVINGSTLTLGETSDNESYFGDNWALDLSDESTAGTHFEGATVSGAQTGTSASFARCEIGTVTVAADTHFADCGISGTMTLPVGSVVLNDCHHDGATAPVLDFGGGGNSTVHCHGYKGAIEVQNMGTGTDIVHLDGGGTLTMNANCSGGTIHLRGNWKIIDNASAAVTLNYDAPAEDVAAALVDTNELQTDWTNAGRLDAILDAVKAVTDLLPDSGALTTIGADTARLTAARAAVLTDWINGGRLDLLLDLVLSTGSTGPWTSASGGATQRKIHGSVSGTGTTVYLKYHLAVDGILAANTSLATPTITGVFAHDGTDLDFVASTGPTVVAPGIIHATGTITAPTVNQAVSAKVKISHGGSLRDGMIHGVVLAS